MLYRVSHFQKVACTNWIPSRWCFRNLSSSSLNVSHKNQHYDQHYLASIHSPEEFWAKAAGDISWKKKWEKVLDDSSLPICRWFVGAHTNTCYNALDRHVEGGRGDQDALIYDSPFTNTIQKYTYSKLLEEVAKFAGVLEGLGIQCGDRVIIYMPMIPNAVIAMLACARLGAIHSVVFGGFASDQLAFRINHTQPKAIISASCGFGASGVIKYKILLDKALEIAAHKPEHVIVYQRPEHLCDMRPGEIDWEEAMTKAKPAKCVTVQATDPLYILYTSGTTGEPKGIVRDTGGHMVALRWSMEYVYGLKPGDIWFAASDIGWVVGHSYIVYAPLFQGCTTVLYEGRPVGTPDAGAYFRVIQQHKVKSFFCAPTSFRAIKREDPEGKLIKKYNLSNFKSLFLAGERSDPDTVQWAEKLLNVPVIDHWWQTESGWPMGANFLGLGPTRFPTRYGSCTKPVPGWKIEVLKNDGTPCKPDELGNVVARLPLPPGALQTLYKHPQKYHSTYFSQFPGFYSTGDAGFIDSDGYLSIMTRTDDIINVGAIRLSTGAIEEVLCTHRAVAECAVIGPDDEYWGQLPIGFVVLKNGVTEEKNIICKELVQIVREKIGPFTKFKKIAIVSSLPKTRSGKVLRKVMKNMANGQPANPPGTIDDLRSLDEINTALEEIGYPIKKMAN